MKVIRKPKLSEMSGIKKLLDAAAQNGDLLRRPLMELFEMARDFFIYVDENGVGGCCALHIDMEDLAEIRSLAVREDLRKQGIGAQLIEACINDARALGITRVYALTRVPNFFARQGFSVVNMEALPHKVFQDCMRCPLYPDCDEVAVLRQLEIPAESLEETSAATCS